MSSRSLKQLTKTIGFRLTVWSASLFILSGLVLFGVTYALLASSLRQRDRDGIRLKLRDLAAQYQLAGSGRLKQELAVQETLQQTRPFFIRLAAPSNATLFLKLPARGPEFDVRRLERRGVTGTDAWLKVRAKGKDEVLEVASTRLPDGSRGAGRLRGGSRSGAHAVEHADGHLRGRDRDHAPGSGRSPSLGALGGHR